MVPVTRAPDGFRALAGSEAGGERRLDDRPHYGGGALGRDEDIVLIMVRLLG